MFKEKLIELDKKFNEIQTNYELARQSRIELVETIEKLDDKLLELEEELETTKLNLENNRSIKIKNNQLLKSSIERYIMCTIVSLAILFGLDLIMYQKLTAIIFKSVIAVFTNTIANMLPYFLFKNNNSSKQHKMRRIEEIEKEYNETLEKRLTEGRKYKNVRDREVVTEKIYKNAKKVLDNMQNNNQTTPYTKSIDTKDIFYTIKLDSPFTTESTEEKIKILDEKLIEYLRKKVSESYYNIISPEELKTFTAKELINILSRQISEDEHKEKLGNIIHAILGFISTIQGYEVVWFEESDEALINNPEIIFDKEGRLSELKTHKNTNYEMLFEIVYDTFTNKVMKEDKNKTRKRTKI